MLLKGNYRCVSLQPNLQVDVQKKNKIKKTGQFVFVASENLYFKGQEAAYDFGCSQTIKCSFSFFKPCRFKPPALENVILRFSGDIWRSFFFFLIQRH